MKIIITGGAGFIGSHLVDHFLQQEQVEKITIVDSLDSFYDPQIKERRIDKWNCEQRVTHERIDIRDGAKLDRVFSLESWDAVLHLAAIPGVRPSLQQPLHYVDVDVVGTVQLLECVVRYQVPHLLFFSSSSVYGRQGERKPWVEGMTKENPENPYAASKLAAEFFCRSFQQLYGFALTILRPFTVYGPEQRPDMAIRRFAEQMLKGETLQLYDTNSSREYTYVKDVVQAVQLSLQKADGYRLFNVGSGEIASLHTVIDLLSTALDVEPQFEVQQRLQGEVLYTWADLTRAKQELGYQPQVSLSEGIQKFARWFMSEVSHDK